MGLLLHWHNLVGASVVVVSLFASEQHYTAYYKMSIIAIIVRVLQ